MDRVPSRRIVSTPSFSLLRGSLLAALGLSVAACGGNVSVSTGGGAGSTSSAGAGGSGAGGSGGTSAMSECQNPQPIKQIDGKDSGFVKCADGSIDRWEPATCTVVAKDTCQGTEDSFECHSASDCSAFPNGSCMTHSGGEPGPTTTWCGCQYQCTSDDDCDPGYICACSGVSDPTQAFCIQAVDCTNSADCESGECGYSEYNNGCWVEQRLYCRDLVADSCRVDSQCSNGDDCGKTDGEPAWSCLGTTCAIGRPLSAFDALVFAPSERRADWADEPLAPEVASLTPEVRAALAAHFTAMAAMEHASIGSFARFSLELLALGAPHALLTSAHEAGADEIVHARLAYSLATSYSGQPLGPGRLPITGVAPSTDAGEIVRALVREACVGETVAAAEALALSTMVTDSVLRSLYAQVSRDEARHAELGWRTLAWMLGANPDLAAVAKQAFSEAIASISSAPLVASEVVSPDHGLLSSEALGGLRRKAAVEVVEPCRAALFASLSERAAHWSLALETTVEAPRVC